MNSPRLKQKCCVPSVPRQKWFGACLYFCILNNGFLEICVRIHQKQSSKKSRWGSFLARQQSWGAPAHPVVQCQCRMCLWPHGLWGCRALGKDHSHLQDTSRGPWSPHPMVAELPWHRLTWLWVDGGVPAHQRAQTEPTWCLVQRCHRFPLCPSFPGGFRNLWCCLYGRKQLRTIVRGSIPYDKWKASQREKG